MMQASAPQESQILHRCQFIDFGCDAQIPFEQVTQHSQICIFKPTTCPDCSLNIAKMDLQNHFQDCLGYVQKCPNQCGFQSSSELTIQKHDCLKFLDQEIEITQKQKNDYLKFELQGRLMRARMKKLKRVSAMELKNKELEDLGLD